MGLRKDNELRALNKAFAEMRDGAEIAKKYFILMFMVVNRHR